MTYTLEQIFIPKFKQCLFDKNYGDVDNWEELYTSYIDVSGLGKTGQLGLLTALHNLDVRINFMENWVKMQRMILSVTNEPYYPAFTDLEKAKYGHRVEWINKDQFSVLLDKIEAKEQRIYSEHKMLSKELASMKQAEKPETVDARNSFFTLMNAVEKNRGGAALDEEKINMYRYAVMVNDYLEACKRQEAEYNKLNSKK